MNSYHYCSEKLFEDIIKSKVIWLTPCDLMNDITEIIYIYDEIWKDFKKSLNEEYKEDKEAIEILNIVDKEAIRIDRYANKPYCACFSKDGNILSQWDRYADNSTGFSIGFDLEALGIEKKVVHPNIYLNESIGISKIIYNKDEQFKYVKDVVKYFLANRQHNAMDWISIKSNLKYYSSIFKNKSFKEEEELRIVYYNNEKHNLDTLGMKGPYKYNNSYGSGNRFEIKWYKDINNHAIKEIYIGPKCNKTSDEIFNILKLNNIYLDKTNIIKSNIPYR